MRRTAVWPGAWAVAGLAALIAANYLFRRVLEHPELRLYDFLATFYPSASRSMFSGHYPLWKLLLPNPDIGGAWSTTDLVLMAAIERVLTPAQTWYLFNSLLMAVSFAVSWSVFRSLGFAFTFALCMGFGTQFYHSYAVAGGMAGPLLVIYFELVLVTAYGLAHAPSRVALWRWSAAFAAATMMMVLAYEGWLDFLVFFCCGAALLLPPCRRLNPTMARRLVIMTLALVAVAGLYVWIKAQFAYGQQAGSESDVVFNYSRAAPAIEDVVSNWLTQLYIGVTNFLPPSFLSSSALYALGGDRLVAEQQGYHAPFSYLVPMSYLFLWRYAAGAVAVVFLMALVKAVRALWRSPSTTTVSVTLFLLMIGVGGPTHALVKIRPMKTVPVLGYHTLVGVLGAALLIAYGVEYAGRRLSRVRFIALTAAVWAVVLYGSMTRPAMLSVLAAQVGLGEGLYPDPWRAAELRLGIPFDRPGGDEVYKLVRAPASGFGSAHVEPHPQEWFTALAVPLPPAPEWEQFHPITQIGPSRWRVLGNRGQSDIQILSPRLDLPAHRKVRLRLDVVRDQSRVCLGIYNHATEKWIVVPEILANEYEFDSGEATDVRVTVASCAPRLSENAESIFQVGAGSYEVVQPVAGSR